MFRTMSDVRHANKALGHYWFHRDTLRFFKSRLESELIGGRYFVSSERGPHGPRMFTIREVNPDGSIDTLGDFMAFKTCSAACDAIRALRAV
jgi:hypothetical protein